MQHLKLTVDASDVGAGAVFQQEDNQGIRRPSNQHSIIEKETLVLLLALKHYLNTTVVPVLVYTNHNLIVFINKMKDKNRCLLCWSLTLQVQYPDQPLEMGDTDTLVYDYCLSRLLLAVKIARYRLLTKEISRLIGSYLPIPISHIKGKENIIADALS